MPIGPLAILFLSLVGYVLVVSARQLVTYRREIVDAGKATRRWHIRRYVEERQRSQRRRGPAILYEMSGGHH